MMDVNYQVQEHVNDGTWKGSWRWFSDFSSMRQAKDMLEVYRRYYPKKKFRIETQIGGDAN